MKKLIPVLLLALLLLGVSAAALAGSPAGTVQTGTGVTVIPADQWEKTYPDVYASYMANEQNSEVVDYVTEYPFIATVYEGMAFNTYYGSARGHYYNVSDLTETGRPHKLANCFTCKTADFTGMVNEQGISAYSIPFEDALKNINESLGCYTCHADDPSRGLTVTHGYFVNAMGEDFDNVAGQDAVCAQCHVEYYFDPDTKATMLPYGSLAQMTPDAMLEYYETMDFSDYTNPRTGVRQIKAQHPEFETYMGAGSVHAGMFTCADCHMGKEAGADGTAYVSHNWVSPLQSESIQQTCAACHPDLKAFVQGIQAKTEERTISIGEKLELLTNKLAEAVASGAYTEEELNVIRTLNRRGQWYWDFVFVENSEGAHNSRLDARCLEKAEAMIDAALSLFKE